MVVTGDPLNSTNLKLGALAHSSPRHAKLVPKYDRRKKMEVNSAIWFSPPMSKTHSTIMADTITAPMGLLPITISPIKWVSLPENKKKTQNISITR